MRRAERSPLAPVDPFDLLRRLDPPAERAAEADRGVEPTPGTDTPPARPPDRDDALGGAFVSELRAWMQDPSSEDRLDKLVDTLRLMHLRQSDPEGEENEGALYDAARRHFHRNETQLRSQVRFTERILDRIQTGAPRRRRDANPFQMELRLRAPAGGVASGRFVLASDLPRAAPVEFRAGTLRGRTLPWNDSAAVRFDPERPTLHAGMERIVRAEVDLAECPARPGDQLELCVDVLGDGELMLKLWLEISVDPASGGGA